MPITGCPPVEGLPAVVVAIYTTAAGQLMPNGTPTIIDFGTEVSDTHDAVTTGAAWKFTAPTAGFYQANVHIMFAATLTWIDGEHAYLLFRVDGTGFLYSDFKSHYYSEENVYDTLGNSVLVYLDEGDEFDCQVVQTSGGSLRLYTSHVFNRISLVKIPGA